MDPSIIVTLLQSCLHITSKMNFIRKLPSKIVRGSRLKLPNHPLTTCNPFAQSYRIQGHQEKLDILPGRFKPLEEYGSNNILNQSNGSFERHSRKRRRDDYTDEVPLRSDAKKPLYDKRQGESESNSFPGEGRKKRFRDHYDDDDHYREEKKRRLNGTSVIQYETYAIKQPSQYVDPNRKILEYLFDPKITADGWKKKSDGIEYHTEVCGKSFYEIGHSVVEARENVAATALKKLCNFKRENIFWPDVLLTFQLNQEFADTIARSVHYSCAIIVS